MNQLPILIKCPMADDNLSLRSISPPRQQTTFFTPAVPRFELNTSPYAAFTNPYECREIVTKCHNCSYKCCNEQAERWSVFLKNKLQRKNDFSPSHSDQEQFSKHHIFQETRNTTGLSVSLSVIIGFRFNLISFISNTLAIYLYYSHNMIL